MTECLSLNHPSASGDPLPLIQVPALGHDKAASWLESCTANAKAKANASLANPTALPTLDPSGDKVSEEEVSPLGRRAEHSGAVAAGSAVG